MKIPLVLFVFLSTAALCFADPSPRDYLIGQVSRDVAKSVERAKAEGKPVWIIAWNDEIKGAMGPEYHLGYHYKNPEVKSLVSKNFVQVWTKTDNKEVAEWVDEADKEGIPFIILIDKTGKWIKTVKHSANPEGALSMTQKLVEEFK